MAVSTDDLFSVLGPDAGPSHAVLSLQLGTCFVLFAAIFAFWLSPGGLAWALSKARPSNSGGAAVSLPGPSGVPVLGHVFAFTGSLTHRVLDELSRSSGARKLMAFSVGLPRFVISSEPETAREMLSSSAFADRPVKEPAYELLFHRAMGFAPYGEYWRNLRRISATHLFSPRRIAASFHFRARNGGGGLELERLVSEGYELPGAFNWGDHFPLLRSLDLQGVRRRCRRLCEKVNAFVGAIVEDLRLAPFGAGRSFHFRARNGGGGLELERLVNEGYELLGAFNWGDHFPLLRSLDLQGVRRRCRRLCEKVNAFVGTIVEDLRLAPFGAGRSFHFRARNGGGGLELESLVSEGYELLGAFNWGDHFPPLCALDLQGVRRRCRQLCEKVNAFVGAVVEDLRLAPFGAGRSFHFRTRNGAGGLELERLVSEGYELLGAFNWGDHFPLLRSLDLQGVRRRCRRLCEKVNAFVGAVVEDLRLAPFGAGRSFHFRARNGGGGLELERLVSEGFELLGAFNWGDHFPLLRSLDLQGVRRKCRRLCEKVNAFVRAIVEERLKLSMELKQSLVCRAIHRRAQV